MVGMRAPRDFCRLCRFVSKVDDSFSTKRGPACLFYCSICCVQGSVPSVWCSIRGVGDTVSVRELVDAGRRKPRRDDGPTPNPSVAILFVTLVFGCLGSVVARSDAIPWLDAVAVVDERVV